MKISMLKLGKQAVIHNTETEVRRENVRKQEAEHREKIDSAVAAERAERQGMQAVGLASSGPSRIHSHPPHNQHN